jgi:hypothetical protein
MSNVEPKCYLCSMDFSGQWTAALRVEEGKFRV